MPPDLVTAATRFGMNVRLVHPPEFKLMPDVVDEAPDNARRSGGSLELMDDFDAGFRGADVVYAKSWGALLTAKDETEGAEMAKRYTSWITDPARMALANPIDLHAPAAGRPKRRGGRRGDRQPTVGRLRRSASMSPSLALDAIG